MTEPTTQERCPTCGSDARRVLLDPCVRMQEYQVIDGFGDGPDPWHGSQDVEGGGSEFRGSSVGRAPASRIKPEVAGSNPAPGSQDRPTLPSTTQEAEKACNCPAGFEHHALNCPVHPGEPRTQEAEKAFAEALGALQYFTDLDNPYLGVDQQRIREGRAALHSLRTQHTEMQEQLEAANRAARTLKAELAERDRERLWIRHGELKDQIAKDREEIERLKAALAESNKWHWMQHGVSDHRLERMKARYEARISELERVLASLGQLTAGGSGDAAGSEVE